MVLLTVGLLRSTHVRKSVCLQRPHLVFPVPPVSVVLPIRADATCVKRRKDVHLYSPALSGWEMKMGKIQCDLGMALPQAYHCPIRKTQGLGRFCGGEGPAQGSGTDITQVTLFQEWLCAPGRQCWQVSKCSCHDMPCLAYSGTNPWKWGWKTRPECCSRVWMEGCGVGTFNLRMEAFCSSCSFSSRNPA